MQAGRGYGKTRVGAECVADWLVQYPGCRIALVAPTARDVRATCFEGESGLLSILPASASAFFNRSLLELTLPNGSRVSGFSSEEPDRLRGPNHHFAWCDELAAFRRPETWDMLMFTMRIGNPRVIVTTTPKPTDLIKELRKAKSTHLTLGTTYDNRSNLAPAFFESIISKYEGTRLGRQELLAELLEDVPGALWTLGLIESSRAKLIDVPFDHFVRVVVALDPAVTAGEHSDSTGIVVAALASNGHVYVLDDLTCKESPLGWGNVAISAYRKHRADRIVGEVNNGGELVARNLYAIDPNVAFRAVRASRGKAVRAEPVAALYEQSRVHHVGVFEHLETEMCGFVPGVTTKSPDRMDALVWAITDLVVDPEMMETTETYEDDFTISRW